MIDNIYVKLVPIDPTDRNQFVLDNQEAFKYGATEEFGMRDDHFEEDGEIIPVIQSNMLLMNQMQRLIVLLMTVR